MSFTKPNDYVPYPAPPYLDIDFYKVGHVHQYPEGTEVVYSNMTPRSYRHIAQTLNSLWDKKSVFVGLQRFILEYLIGEWNRGFFQRPWPHIEFEYRQVCDTGLQTVLDISHLKALHMLGYLPVEIRALQEGSVIPERIPVYTIHNTHEKFGWLTNALETVMSNETWKTCTVATIARNFKQTTQRYSQINGSPDFMIPWACHDFSSRGMSGRMDSRDSSIGHLAFFQGTDTVSAIHAVIQAYGADPTKQVIGGSVPATEHSVMCIDGEDNELETFRRILKLYPKGIVSIVSDSFDFWRVMTDYAVQMKDEIMAREGRVVFRPDTGNPVDIICGTAVYVSDDSQHSLTMAYAKALDRKLTQKDDLGHDVFVIFDKAASSYKRITVKSIFIENDKTATVGCYQQPMSDVAPEVRGAYRILYDTFGGTTNAEGFIDLDTHVGLIYGDSITARLYVDILQRLTEAGFSHSNLVVGVGSYSYQYVTRDSLGTAIKAVYGGVKGVGRTIRKDPKTGDGTKKSAAGLLRVYLDGDEYKLVEGIVLPPEQVMAGDFDSGLLMPVFRNGKMLRLQTWHEIRLALGWNDSIPA